jgi:hypothetical protein
MGKIEFQSRTRGDRKRKRELVGYYLKMVFWDFH